jgi:gliding motility-associated-like protein
MNLLRTLLLVPILTFFSINSHASHIVGGEIYYDTLGLDLNGDMQYVVYVELFRDCAGIDFPGEGAQQPFHYTIFDGSGNVIINNIVPFAGAAELPLVYDDPCVEPPDDKCIEGTLYQDTVSLPIIPDDYEIAFQVGNWAGTYVNFANPASLGMTLTSTIPGSNKVQLANNSVRFSDYPQIVFCSNIELTVEGDVIEEDGDSLSFKLCDPLEYDNTGNGLNPSPEEAPPYNSVPWEPGFSATNPFGANPPATIDPITGDFSVTPPTLGDFVGRICIEEWRDGVLINTHSRTFGYSIVECDPEIPFEISFIGGGSSSSQGPSVIEGCGGIQLAVEVFDTSEIYTLNIYTGGSAVEGFNYDDLPDSLVLDSITTDTLDIVTIYQNVEEGTLEANILVVYTDPCSGSLDTVQTFFSIEDYFEMQLEIEDSINLCAEKGDQYLLTPISFSGGVGPYFYEWGNYVTTYPNDDTIMVDATILEDNLNQYNLTVYDACDFEVTSPIIEIYEQCRVVVPNIITPNGDDVNDLFVIRNNADYDRISLQIYNRWGNLIYESNDYQDDWGGTDLNGKQVVDGVYFYTATPAGDKYTYREGDEENPFLMHGYVHVVRGE